MHGARYFFYSMSSPSSSPYSPNFREGEFSEGRIDSPGPTPTTVSALYFLSFSFAAAISARDVEVVNQFGHAPVVLA